MTSQNSPHIQTTPYQPYVDSTNDAYGLYGRPLVLNKIFDLLVAMINIMQDTAATQANRLNFLSAWQQAYTAKMNQVTSFNQGDGKADLTKGVGTYAPPASFTIGGKTYTSNLDSYWYNEALDGSSQEASSLRTAMNNANTTYTQQMQGQNQLLSDDAKALQTNVQRTNDEQQSQSDLATSILQQLQTILSSIYQAPG